MGRRPGPGGERRQERKPFVADLEAIRRGLCDDAQQRKCLAEIGEELLDWTCAKCEKTKQGDLNEYTVKMFQIRHLKNAGYPFAANDLTPEEWTDLGTVEEMMKWPTKAQSR